jgi:hypothetical protein
MGSWETKSYTVRRKQNSELNVWLDVIDAEIKSVFRGMNLDNASPTAEMIKDKLNQRLFNNINLDYSSINLEFYNNFINYLTHELNLSQNTLGKHFRIFKTFLDEKLRTWFTSENSPFPLLQQDQSQFH